MNWFYNLKISAKLLIGFILVAVLAAVVGIFGITDLRTLDNNGAYLYEKMTIPISQLGDLSTSFQRMRVNIIELIISTDKNRSDDQKKRIKERLDDIAKYSNEYEKGIVSQEMRDLFKDFKENLNNYKSNLEKVFSFIDNDKANEALALQQGIMAQIRTKIQDDIDKMTGMKTKQAKETEESNGEVASSAIRMMTIIVVVAVIVAILLGIFISNIISKPLKRGVEMFQELQKGILNKRLNITTKDEIGVLAQTMDQFADDLQKIVVGTMIKISEGDLSSEIITKDQRDEITPALRNTIEALRGLVAEANMLTKAAVDGKLSTRGNASKFKGGYKEIVEGVNSTLDAVIGPLNVAAEYVDRISKGDLPKKITDNYNGDFNEIKNNLNNCIDAINLLVTDAGMLAKAAVEGKLSTRADASKQQGDYKKIVDGVNATLDAVIGPLNVAAEYVDRISKGDLPKKITDNYNGDFNEIKNNLNNCIDAISDQVKMAQGVANGDLSVQIQVRSENDILSKSLIQVTVVLKGLQKELARLTAASREGMLSERGKPEQFQGAYSEVVSGINEMLDAILLPIGEGNRILRLIRNGNLREKVEVVCRGEHQQMKDAINGVHTWLSNLIAYITKMANGDTTANMDKASNDDQIHEWLMLLKTNIIALVTDANMLAKAAVEGKLSTRADASKHQGDYRKIVEGVNETLDKVINPINESVQVMQKMEKGDLDIEVSGNYLGDHALLKNAINGTLDSLNEILSQVATTVEQVMSGANQVSDASQSLSQGATEQAASIEEITSSMNEIGSQTKLNAENANQANQLAQVARSSAEKGNKEMDQLMAAMNEITESSKNISKIIKVIDEIAFQTNLLALNAAVEAARAGRHGKGFAVVAEEVRNLAARSAKAAKETAEMIEGSIKRVENGSAIATRTSEALNEIRGGATKVTDIVAEIAASSNEQAQSVSQINTGLSQIDKVTQQNTASSEESASAAEELSGQSAQLSEMIKRFKIRNSSRAHTSYEPVKHLTDGKTRPHGTVEKEHKMKMVTPKDIINLDDSEFGKF